MSKTRKAVRVPTARQKGSKAGRSARGSRRAPGGPTVARRFRRTKRFFTFLGVLVTSAALFGLYIYAWVIPWKEIARLKDGYVVMSYEDGRVHYSSSSVKPRDWMPLSAAPKKVAMAFVLSEDARFYLHRGLDINEIHDALTDAVRGGKHLRGASTITQQVAKNLYLNQSYSWWRKIKEAPIALVLDRELPKDKTLEVYLNTIEYGEGLYGITAASRHYFGKEPTRLTAKEAAFLATLLPSPKRYSQDLREHGLTKQVRAKIGKILEAMRWLDYLSAEEFKRETSAPLNFTRKALGSVVR